MSLGTGKPLQFLLARFKVTDSAEKPLADVTITVKAIDSQKRETEITARTDANGEVMFSVPQSGLPQLPMDAEFEAVGPKNSRERGKVRVGGNEFVHTKELVLQGA